MSTAYTDNTTTPPRDDDRAAPQQPGPRTGAEHGFWHGRSGLVLPLIMAGFSTYLLYGILTMEVPEGTDFPGPRFFPGLLMVAGYVLAALLVLHYLRTPEPPEELSDRTYRTHTDWSALAWAVGGFLLFALLLEHLGWILAAALLFWCVARGIGSKRHLFDISLALTLSSVIYLAFDVGLGLNLPSGVLGGSF